MASINADTTEGWWLWIGLLASALQCFRGPSELNLAHIIIDLYTQSVNNYEHNSYPRKMRYTFDTKLVRITLWNQKTLLQNWHPNRKKNWSCHYRLLLLKISVCHYQTTTATSGLSPLISQLFSCCIFCMGHTFFLQFGCFCVDIYLGLILAPVVHIPTSTHPLPLAKIFFVIKTIHLKVLLHTLWDVHYTLAECNWAVYGELQLRLLTWYYTIFYIYGLKQEVHFVKFSPQMFHQNFYFHHRIPYQWLI